MSWLVVSQLHYSKLPRVFRLYHSVIKAIWSNQIEKRILTLANLSEFYNQSCLLTDETCVIPEVPLLDRFLANVWWNSGNVEGVSAHSQVLILTIIDN